MAGLADKAKKIFSRGVLPVYKVMKLIRYKQLILILSILKNSTGFCSNQVRDGQLDKVDYFL